MTVLDVLTASAGYFEKHGVESPRLNAELLAAHVLGLKRLELYLQYDRPLDGGELERLRELTRQRGQGRPLQHLLGSTGFLGRDFSCDARALVPRPETEQLAEFVLERLKARAAAPGRVLDMGTGSGVLAISLALAFPAADVVAVDVSAEALALAGENAAMHGTANVRCIQSDLFANVDGAFDVAMANLPYIATGDLADLSREVRHDPTLALDGGEDGTAVIGRFLDAALGRLQPGGFVALEIGHGQALALASMAREKKYGAVEILRDYQDRERFLFAAYG